MHWGTCRKVARRALIGCVEGELRELCQLMLSQTPSLPRANSLSHSRQKTSSLPVVSCPPKKHQSNTQITKGRWVLLWVHLSLLGLPPCAWSYEAPMLPEPCASHSHLLCNYTSLGLNIFFKCQPTYLVPGMRSAKSQKMPCLVWMLSWNVEWDNC